ncbi:phage polarity suppression protein, partial [Klebsiella pneumoniae]|uniref:phage polarity suppression protein n=1 Tax=Klebsiella pneumoniae TaxID=573 RepID=UPI000B66E5D8
MTTLTLQQAFEACQKNETAWLNRKAELAAAEQEYQEQVLAGDDRIPAIMQELRDIIDVKKWEINQAAGRYIRSHVTSIMSRSSCIIAVSYTHLDVYKRQEYGFWYFGSTDTASPPVMALSPAPVSYTHLDGFKAPHRHHSISPGQADVSARSQSGRHAYAGLPACRYSPMWRYPLRPAS